MAYIRPLEGRTSSIDRHEGLDGLGPEERFVHVVDQTVGHMMEAGLHVTAPVDQVLGAIRLVGVEHTFSRPVEFVKGQEDDLSWVPTLIECVRNGSDEVIREVVYFTLSKEAGLQLNVWDSTGRALYGHLLPVQTQFGVMGGLDAHGHMAKKADLEGLVEFVETVGCYLWGPAWTLTVAEEDRC